MFYLLNNTSSNNNKKKKFKKAFHDFLIFFKHSKNLKQRGRTEKDVFVNV